MVTSEEFTQLKKSLERETLRFEIASGSMEPVIATGAWIEVGPCDPARLKVFDIIVFLESGKLVCHYVRHLNEIPDPRGEKLVITAPLSGQLEDLPVAHSRVLGRVLNYRLSLAERARIALRALARKAFK